MATDELPTLKGIKAIPEETGARLYKIAQPFLAIDPATGEGLEVVHASDYLEVISLALRYKAELIKARRHKDNF